MPKAPRTPKRQTNPNGPYNPKRNGGQAPIMGPNGMKLKQLQYRSYIYDIQIFHYQDHYLNMDRFRSLLNRREHGYVDLLTSFDPLDGTVYPDDTIAPDCIEVAYLLNVFQHGGCALGFRLGNNAVEFMCFDRQINDMLYKTLNLEYEGPNGKEIILFDHVGSLPKGSEVARGVRGANAEHRAWHTSLWESKKVACGFKLTWKNFAKELWKFHEEQREAARLRGEQGDVEMEEDDEWDENMVDVDEEGYAILPTEAEIMAFRARGKAIKQISSALSTSVSRNWIADVSMTDG